MSQTILGLNKLGKILSRRDLVPITLFLSEFSRGADWSSGVDIVIHAEEIGGIVFLFDGCQT